MSRASEILRDRDFGSSNRLLEHTTKGKMGFGNMAFGAVLGTTSRMKQGDAAGSALLKGIGTSALWAVAPAIPKAQMAFGLVSAGIKGGVAVNKNIQNRLREDGKIGTNFQYTDTQQAQTMRQSAVQAIQGSKMNARNSLGGEAALMHKSNLRR